MLPKLRQSRLPSLWLSPLFLLVLMFASSAFAASEVSVNLQNASAADMLKNIATQLPNLMRLVTAFAYVMGMYFILLAVFKLKQYGEQRTMMSSEHQLKGPIIYLAVGTMLLYLPSAVDVGLTTFWTEPNPYGYLQEEDQWGDFLNSVFLIIQLFGVIAFIRGLVILSHLSGHGGQPGNFGRGITHIIGGIFCINIYQFIQVVLVTLGIATTR